MQVGRGLAWAPRGPGLRGAWGAGGLGDAPEGLASDASELAETRSNRRYTSGSHHGDAPARCSLPRSRSAQGVNEGARALSDVGLGALTLVTGRCRGGRLASAASISSKADWIVFVSSADSCRAIGYPAGGTRVGGMGSARRGLAIVDAGSESRLNELMGSRNEPRSSIGSVWAIICGEGRLVQRPCPSLHRQLLASPWGEEPLSVSIFQELCRRKEAVWLQQPARGTSQRTARSALRPSEWSIKKDGTRRHLMQHESRRTSRAIQPSKKRKDEHEQQRAAA